MLWPRLSIALAKAVPLIGMSSFVLLAAFGIGRRRRHHQDAKRNYDDAKSTDSLEPVSLHPQIDPARCAGCGACVRACPEGTILQLVNHRAVLTAPTLCVGHGQCEIACPFDAITLVFGTKTRGKELPRLNTNYETNVPGLYIAGELGGMGLIRNAIRQGRLASEHAASHLGGGRAPADVDILIVGAGAAGLSASLAAIAAGRSYLCIEQNSIGGTIYNFPRQKVVMTQPAELPMVGTVRFPGHKVSKEELLAYWSGVMRRTGLKVKEGCKFHGLRPEGNVFHVDTSRGAIRARKVILAMGVRGSPRKLGVPGEGLPKVTYNLIDPEQYQRCDVAVVGGGNAAVEAAQMLADPKYRNRVRLLVRGKALDRANRENRANTMELAEKGLLRIDWDTTVAEVFKDALTIEHEGQRTRIRNHYLFIFAGAEMPFKFLESLGIKIEKKFGEAPRRS